MKSNTADTSTSSAITDPILSSLRDPVQPPGEGRQGSSSGNENTGKGVVESSQESGPSQQDMSGSGEVTREEDTSVNMPGFGRVNSTALSDGANQQEVVSPENIYLLVSDSTDLIPIPFMASSPALVWMSG
jgi:hypothetical protein